MRNNSLPLLLVLLLNTASFADDPATKGDFVRSLPADFKDHYLIITDSESKQPASPLFPRFLLRNGPGFSPYGDSTGKIYGLSTMRDKSAKYVENGIEEYAFDTRAGTSHQTLWNIHEGKWTPSDQTDQCTACHTAVSPQFRLGQFDTYNGWPNQLPFSGGTVRKGSAEAKAYINMLENLAEDPVVSQLKKPRGVKIEKNPAGKVSVTLLFPADFEEKKDPVTNEVTHIPRFRDYTGPSGRKYRHYDAGVDLGNSGRVAGEGTEMFDELSRTNATRVREELKLARLESYRYVLEAINKKCITNQKDLTEFLPEHVLKKLFEHHRVGDVEQLVDKTREIRTRAYLSKLRSLKEHLRSLITSNATVEGQKLKPEELAEQLEVERLFAADAPDEDGIRAMGAIFSPKLRSFLVRFPGDEPYLLNEEAKKELLSVLDEDSQLETLQTDFLRDSRDESISKSEKLTKLLTSSQLWVSSDRQWIVAGKKDTENLAISLYRLILEPHGVQMRYWSFGIGDRAHSYTFGDRWSFYEQAPRKALSLESLKGLDCKGLAKESLKLFQNPGTSGDTSWHAQPGSSEETQTHSPE